MWRRIRLSIKPVKCDLTKPKRHSFAEQLFEHGVIFRYFFSTTLLDKTQRKIEHS